MVLTLVAFCAGIGLACAVGYVALGMHHGADWRWYKVVSVIAWPTSLCGPFGLVLTVLGDPNLQSLPTAFYVYGVIGAAVHVVAGGFSIANSFRGVAGQKQIQG